MKLRKYRKEDSVIICSWIKDEDTFYKWSADRINKFPIADDDLNEHYKDNISDRFIPLTAVDESDNPIGHLFLRYPNEKDNTEIRFGYVIINPELRGQGLGKTMLKMAIDYAKNVLNASKITLRVFANNNSARHCYKSVGFIPNGIVEKYKMPVGEWDCIELELKIKET
jgi:RimJ/RimL family protein N-acetyltransferase